MATLDDFLSQTETYVERGLNLTVKQQEWTLSFQNIPQEELRERLELFKSAQYKLNNEGLQPRGKNNDGLDMNLRPTDAERKKIVTGTKNPQASGRMSFS